MKPFVLFAAISSLAFAQGPPGQNPIKSFRGIENARGLVHGDDHTYAIQAPKGWVLDNEIMAEQHVFAVFYEAGKAIGESPLVGYSRIHPKHPKGFDVLIKEDLQASTQGVQTAKTEKHPGLKTKDGREARIFSIKGIPGQNPEWVAYIDAPTVVILVGVSVRKLEDLPKGLPLLSALVGSVEWINDGMQFIDQRTRN